ncbi:MAG: ketosteroid isomerase-like protein [Gammaproteobacteria bacterium]|jgi:ketosteroid isomerase-like protein
MKLRMFAIIAAVLYILVPAGVSAESVLEQITAANNAFAKSIVAGDIDYLVNDYTDDACIIAPKAPLTCGKESIRSFWSSVVASKPKNVEILTHGAGSEGKLAYATGELIITDAESAEQFRTGIYCLCYDLNRIFATLPVAIEPTHRRIMDVDDVTV